MNWRDLVEVLKKYVPEGRVTTYGDIAEWAYASRLRNRPVRSLLVGARINGYGKLTNRVVKVGGELADLPGGTEQQRTQLEAEGIPFAPNGAVDFHKIDPVRLDEERRREAVGDGVGVFRIPLDGHWELYDLHEYTHAFVQLYSLVTHLELSRSDTGEFRDVTNVGVDGLMGSFPWRGGYSSANFYRKLHGALPKSHIPDVRGIVLLSPGYLEVGAYLPSVGAISLMVALFLRNANQIADFVKRLRKDAREHKLADIDAKKKDLELSRAQLTFVKDSVKDFEELLGIPAANILAEFLPNDLAKLRAEMSIHNRLKTVAKYEASGKAIVSEPGRELYREREYVEAQRSERHMRAKRKSEFQTDERRFLELPKPQSGDEEHLAPDKSPAADDAQKEGQLDISFDKSSSS